MDPQTEEYHQIMISLKIASGIGADNELVSWCQSAPPQHQVCVCIYIKVKTDFLV